MADFISDDEMAKLEKTSGGADFISDDDMDKMTSKPSSLESTIRGGAQGASLGFADELTGAAEAAYNKLRGNPESLSNLYEKYRNESRNAYKAAEEANPTAYTVGEIGGGLTSFAIPGLNAAKGADLAQVIGKAALQGGLMGAGSAKEMSNIPEAALKGAGWGGLFGGAGGAAGAGLGAVIGKASPVVENLSSKLGDKSSRTAELLAEKATGATGVQSAKFADDAGRQLLDRGLVRFADTPEKIAERVGAAQSRSGKGIGEALTTLDERGVTGSLDNIVASLQNKIDELSQSYGNGPLIKKLQGEIDDIVGQGRSQVPVSVVEKSKRTFQGNTNYNSPEIDKQASAHLADAFMKESERAALAADPALASKFIDDKKTFGLLAPIKEAAEKRANQLNQSPFGGFGDMAAGAGGLAGGGAVAAIPAIAARRFAAPRAASAAAIGFDKLGDILKSAPQVFGKFAPVLQNAAQRGTQALGAAHFILQQSNPEYQEMLMKMEEDGQ